MESAKSWETWLMQLRSPDAAQRATAAEELSHLGEGAQPAALGLLVACEDEDPTVCEQAISALESLGPPALADLPQILPLTQSSATDVAYWAITLLGRLEAQAKAAVEPLTGCLAPQRPLAVRQRAAWALGRIGYAPAATLTALQQASQDPDPRLSRLALQAMQQCANHEPESR